MKVWVVAVIFVLMIFSGCENRPQKIQDVQLQENNDRLEFSDSKACDSPFREAVCPEGYVCVNVSVNLYDVGVCFSEQEVSRPDFNVTDKRINELLKDGAILVEN